MIFDLHDVTKTYGPITALRNLSVAMPDGAVGFAIGDAAGHGLGPALLMASAHAYLRALAEVRPYHGLADVPGRAGDHGGALREVEHHR